MNEPFTTKRADVERAKLDIIERRSKVARLKLKRQQLKDEFRHKNEELDHDIELAELNFQRQVIWLRQTESAMEHPFSVEQD